MPPPCSNPPPTSINIGRWRIVDFREFILSLTPGLPGKPPLASELLR